ncbi:MAG: VWA domain-containing protein [Spirochaetia bacterium]
MTFTNPTGLIFFISLPLILFFHLVRLKYREKEISSLFFWNRINEKKSSLRRFLNLPVTLLLILQLSAAALLSTAALKPEADIHRKLSGKIAVVIDASGSMRTREGSGTRYQKAVSEIIDLVRNTGRNTEITVVAAGAVPDILVPWTDDKETVIRNLRSSTAEDGPGGIPAALDTIYPLFDSNRKSNVFLFTDGNKKAAALQYPGISIPDMKFSGGVNSGITSFRFRKKYGKLDSYEILVRCKNFSGETREADLIITVDGEALYQDSFILPPDGEKTVIYEYSGPVSGIITAGLYPEDDLPQDNFFRLSFRRTDKVTVSVPPDIPFFLEEFLSVYPNLAVKKVKSAAVIPETEKPEDISILHGPAVSPLRPGNYLIFGAPPPGFFREGQTGYYPEITSVNRSHPVIAGADFSALDPSSYRVVYPSPETPVTELIGTEAGGLGYAYRSGGISFIYFPFLLDDTAFTLDPSFPVLMHNALSWLDAGGFEEAEQAVALGEELPLTQFRSGPIVIMTPDGSRVTVTNPDKMTYYPRNAGIYRIIQDDRIYPVAVNLEDPSEMDADYPAEDTPVSGHLTPSERASAYPLWQIFAIAGLAFLVTEFIVYIKRIRPRRGRAVPFLVLRVLSIAAAAAALSGFSFTKEIKPVSVVFLVDESESVPDGKIKENFANLIDGPFSLPETTETAVISFGASASPVKPLSSAPPVLSDSDTGSGGTNIEKAVRLALSMLKENTRGKIFLLSDGLETDGNALRAADASAGSGVPIYTVPAGGFTGSEVLVKHIRLPEDVRKGKPHTVSIVVGSNIDTAASLVLYLDGEYIGEAEILLTPGENVFTYTGQIDTGGIHEYEAVIISGEDTIAGNNSYQTAVILQDEPSVLYVAEADSPVPAFEVLRNQNFNVKRINASEIPAERQKIMSYDLIVMDNVGGHDISLSKMNMLKDYVEHGGGGFLMLGGDSSFGLGGYYGTPVEDLLPVSMDVSSSKDIPSLTIVFIVDKSGSMGGTSSTNKTKLDLVKEAVFRSIEILNPFYGIGMLSFDADREWTVPVTRAGNRDEIVSRLATLESGGGTNLYAALEEGLKTVSDAESAVKHVVLLSDGLADKENFSELLALYKNSSVTISTIAVGNDADQDLMRSIAEAGAGRYYHTDSITEIPRLFTTESLIVSRGFVLEESFVPVQTHTHPVTQELPSDLPVFEGLILTYNKDAGDLLIEGPGGNPLLSLWRYGLGKSAAFTADMKGIWSSRLLTWDGFEVFVTRLTRWLERPGQSEELTLSIHQNNGNRAEITLEALDLESRYINYLDLTASVIRPGTGSLSIPLKQTAPGRYSGTFEMAGEGIFFITAADDDGKYFARTKSITIPYPEEYNKFGTDTELLSAIARRTGGRMITRFTPGQDSWWEDNTEFTETGENLLFFLAAALFLLVLEIVLRRRLSRRPEDSETKFGGPKYSNEELYVMIGRGRKKQELAHNPFTFSTRRE